MVGNEISLYPKLASDTLSLYTDCFSILNGTYRVGYAHTISKKQLVLPLQLTSGWA